MRAKLVIVAAALLTPVFAYAEPEPSFEMLDRGDAVEVIAYNVKATHTIVNPVRSRLEVAIAGHPSIKRELPTDATVKLIEITDEDSTKVISVKLGFERADVKSLARFAQAIQVGDDLHLLFPRKVPAEGELAKLPEPTLPAQITASTPMTVETIKPDVKPEAKPQPTLETTAAANDPATKPATAPTPTPAIGTTDQNDVWSKLTTYGAIGLAAAGCGVWLMRRKKAQPAAVQSIELIAQRSLGAKAKMMWLAAGERELIVSVTPQHVRMLGSWPRGSTQMPRQMAQDIPVAQATIAQPRTITQNRSPAVNGILRLRAQTVQPISEDIATDDIEADSLWAREILAAAGGKR